MWMSTKIPIMPNTSWSNSWLHALKISVSLGMLTSLFMAGGERICRISWTLKRIILTPRSFCWRKIIVPLKPSCKAANDVIKNNRHRRPKNLWTQNEDGEEIVYYRANDEQDEAVFVAKTIEELSREAGYKHRDFAVLYRTNAQSRTIEEARSNPTFPTPW